MVVLQGMSEFAALRAELCRLSEANQQSALEKARHSHHRAGRARWTALNAAVQTRLSSLWNRGGKQSASAPSSEPVCLLPDETAADLPAWTRNEVPSPAAAARHFWRSRLRPTLHVALALLRRTLARLRTTAIVVTAGLRSLCLALRPKPGGLKRLGLGIGAAALLTGLGSAIMLGDLGAVGTTGALLGSASAAADLPDTWLPSERPIQTFSISAPSFIDGELTYRAERNLAGPARRDTLMLGTLDSDGPWLGLALHRQLSIDGHELAATAGRLSAGSVTAPTGSTTLETKFGPVVAADVKAGLPGHQRACLAFGRHEEVLRFAFQGLYCAGNGKMAELRTLQCLIDRIELVGGSSDPQLRAFFVGTEKRRDFCGAGDLRATGAKRAWFQGGPSATAPYAASAAALAIQNTKQKRILK